MSDNPNEKVEIEVNFTEEELVVIRKELKKTINKLSKPSGRPFRVKYPDNWKYINEIFTLVEKKKSALILHARHCSTLGGYFESAYAEKSLSIYLAISRKMESLVKEWQKQYDGL